MWAIIFIVVFDQKDLLCNAEHDLLAIAKLFVLWLLLLNSAVVVAVLIGF